MKAHSRFSDDGGRKRAKPSKRSATKPKPAAASVEGRLPADMIRLKNGRIVRKGEFVVYVRLRRGGHGVYVLSEDLIYLPADEDIAALEIDRGISLNSPLILHPELEAE